MGKSKQTFKMKTVVFIFALLAFAACQGVNPKGDAKTGAPATAPTPAPKPAASGDAKKPAAKPATPAKDAKKDDKKPAAPAKADDKKKPAAPAKDAKKDDKKAGDKKPAAPAKDAKKDDGKSGAKVVYADRHKPNCCLRSKTDGRYYPAICGHRRFLQAAKPADKKAPTTRNDGAQTFYCPKQTNPVVNTPAAAHPAPKNGTAPATPAKKLRRMQAVKPKEDFTCKAYARRLQAVPAPAPKADDKKDDKKPAPAPKADDKKKTDDKKPAPAPKADDKKKPAAPAKDDKKKADDKKKPAAPAKDDKKKPASNMPVTCGSKVYGTVTYTCMTTTKRHVCLYTAP